MGTLFDEFKKFNESSFREFYKKYIYINCREVLDEMLPGELDDNITGIVAYCYIDSTEGLSFRPCALAVVKDNSLQEFTFPHQEDTIFVLRLREGEVKMNELHNGDRHMYLYAVDPNKYSFFDVAILNMDTSGFERLKSFIDENYSVSEIVEEMRTEKYAFLDRFRHPSYPDDVRALLLREENGIEQIWARLTFVTKDNEIFAELLNEPYKDFGCREGSLIELALAKTGDDMVLVFTGRMAE